MKRIRLFNALGLVCNLGIVALCVLSYFAIAKGISSPEAWLKIPFARFDVLASLITILAAVLMLVANLVSTIKGETRIPRLFTAIYFIAAAMSLVVLITNLCFGKYNNIPTLDKLFSTEGGVLYYGFLIPLIAVIDFLFIAIDKKLKFPVVFVPFGAGVIYVAGILIAIAATNNPAIAPYPFFHILPSWIPTVGSEENLPTNIIVLVSFILILFAISVVMWLINRIDHRIIFGTSLEELEEELNSKGKKEKVGLKKAVTGYLKESVKFNNSDKPGTCYHISYHRRKLKTWKVKGEEAGRALKVFDTQKEAIEYAKALVAKNGGSIRIHSMVGRIRKDW